MAAIGHQKITGRKIHDFQTWGKHFLIVFKDFAGRKEIGFYTKAVTMIEQDLDEVYDWSADVMSDSWDPRMARKN